MTVEIRPITEDEFVAFHRLTSSTFGEDSSEEAQQSERLIFEFDRSLAALDGGDFVASAGAYSFELTLPGGTFAPAAGVTWVGVLPTHRRQGILTALMQRQIDDVAERGEPFAILTASEAVIYGRFGYGVATHFATAEILAANSGFHTEPQAGGRIRLLDAEAARKVLPAVADQHRRRQPGALTRSERYWDSYFLDLKDWRDGASARFYAVHENEAGEADGYAAYRVKETWTPEAPGKTVALMQMHVADPEVEAALFRYLLDIDLQWQLTCHYRPLHDPLRWRLADSRRYRISRVNDWLWVRPVDIAAALAARRYAVDDSLVFEVTDPFRPANDGRYRLDGGPGGATCTRLDAAGPDADIRLPVDALGSAYLGGVRFTTLTAGARVAGEPDALRRADAMFASTPPPYCDLGF